MRYSLSIHPKVTLWSKDQIGMVTQFFPGLEQKWSFPKG
jgi:hypothetical protein